MHQPSDKVDLTCPTSSSQRETIVFDGECQFCRRQMERLASWDRRRRLTFISLHDPRVGTLFPDLEHAELMRHIYLIDASGKRHKGAAAFAYLSRKLPRLWLLAPWLHIPGSLPLWQWLYHQLAKRRYALNRDQCKGGHCDVHS